MSHAGLVEKVTRFGPLTVKTFVRPEELENDPDIRSGAAVVLPSSYPTRPLPTPYSASFTAGPHTTSTAFSPSAGSPPTYTPVTLKKKRGRPKKQIPSEQPTPSATANNGSSTATATDTPDPTSTPAGRSKNKINSLRASNPLKVTGQPLLHLLSEEERVALNRRHKQGRDFIPSWKGVVKELKNLGRPVPEEELARIHEEHYGEAARLRAAAAARDEGQEEPPQQQQDPNPNLPPDQYQQQEQTHHDPYYLQHQSQDVGDQNGDGFQQQTYEPLRPHDHASSIYETYHNPFGPYQPPGHRDDTTGLHQGVAPLSYPDSMPPPRPPHSTIIAHHPPPPPPPPQSDQLPAAVASMASPPSQSPAPAEPASIMSPVTADVENTETTHHWDGTEMVTFTVRTPHELTSTLRSLLSSTVNVLGIPEVVNCRLNLHSTFPFPPPISTTAESMHPDAFKLASSNILSLVQETDGFSWTVRRNSQKDFFKREWVCSQLSLSRSTKANNTRQRYDCAGTLSVTIKPRKGAGGNEVWLNYRHHAIHGPPETVRGGKRRNTEDLNAREAKRATTENSLQMMFEQWEKPKSLKPTH